MLAYSSGKPTNPPPTPPPPPPPPPHTPPTLQTSGGARPLGGEPDGERTGALHVNTVEVPLSERSSTVAAVSSQAAIFDTARSPGT